MKVFFILLTMAVLLWKAFYVWQRGMNTYKRDRQEHQSLYEYLLGNGATETEALRPFLVHALERAYQPLQSQWRLLLALVAFALLTGLVADNLNVGQSLLLLLALLALVGLGTLAVLYVYTRKIR